MEKKISINEYRARLSNAMKETYSFQTIGDLLKRMDCRPKNYEEMEKDQLIDQFLGNIFETDVALLYPLMCVISQFDKYRLPDEIIHGASRFVKAPAVTQRICISTNLNELVSSSVSYKLKDKIALKDGDIRLNSNLKAIVIGVDEDVFGNKNGSYCANDAQAMYDFLINDWKVPEENIFFKTGRVTGKEARDALRTYCNLKKIKGKEIIKTNPEDCLLFYFAGYGMNYHGKSYLMTSDSYIHTSTVRNALQLISVNQALCNCPAKIKLRIFDANFAGQHLDKLLTRVKNVQPPISSVSIIPKKEREEMLKDVLKSGSGWITFTASDADQFSHESSELEHSLFTYYLLNGLRGAAKRRNDIIHMEDLKIYVCEKMMKTVYPEQILQVPQYQCELNGNLLME